MDYYAGIRPGLLEKRITSNHLVIISSFWSNTDAWGHASRQPVEQRGKNQRTRCCLLFSSAQPNPRVRDETLSFLPADWQQGVYFFDCHMLINCFGSVSPSWNRRANPHYFFFAIFHNRNELVWILGNRNEYLWLERVLVTRQSSHPRVCVTLHCGDGSLV